MILALLSRGEKISEGEPLWNAVRSGVSPNSRQLKAFTRAGEQFAGFVPRPQSMPRPALVAVTSLYKSQRNPPPGEPDASGRSRRSRAPRESMPNG